MDFPLCRYTARHLSKVATVVLEPFNLYCDREHSISTNHMPHTAQLSTSLRLLRTGFRNLGPLFPGLAGRLAYRLWFSTRRFPEPSRESQWLSHAQTDSIRWQNRPLMRYQWGDPAAPAVLLIHGWNGRGAQLGGFAAALNAAGLRAVAFDAPAHGRSPGDSTNIFEYAEAVQCVAASSGQVVGAIAHSFGAPACARALLQGLKLPRLVSISAPASAEFLLQRFAHTLAIPAVAITAMRSRIQQHFGIDIFARLATETMLADQTLPGLIIHDQQDRDVPSTHAERLLRAWRDSQLLLTEGLGHQRILRDPEVIAAAVSFLNPRG